MKEGGRGGGGGGGKRRRGGGGGRGGGGRGGGGGGEEEEEGGSGGLGGGRGGGRVRGEDDVSPMAEKGGNMFELFRTYDEEEEYTVYVREDGKRFYVDWEEQVGR